MRALQVGLVAVVVAGVGAVLTTSSTGCTSASQVRQVFMALDGAGDRPRNTFFTDTTTIYCDIVFSGYSNDETIDVQFVQDKGEDPIFNGSGDTNQPVQRDWGSAETVPGTGIQTIGFTLNRPQAVDGGTTLPFPVGHWKCLVSVNGDSAGEADFTIEYPTPDCPATGGAYDGLECVDHKVGSTCPSDSNLGNATACTCQGTPDPTTRVWVCQ